MVLHRIKVGSNQAQPPRLWWGEWVVESGVGGNLFWDDAYV